MKYSALLLAGAILAGSIFTPTAFAHTFSGDESASFIATVEGTRAHLQLVQDNFGSNNTLAQEHAEHAASHLDEHIVEEISERNERLGRELPASLADLSESIPNSTAQQIGQKIANINDLLSETVSVRVENDQMNNATVHALVLANIADDVLTAYAGAYGIKTNDLHDSHDMDGSMTHEEESMTADSSGNMSHDAMGENESMSHDGMETGEAGNDTIVSIAHYQSAQALAARMQEYYDAELKDLAAVNATAAASFESGLAELNQAIGDRASNTDVTVIVHTKVHANLQKAYNLQIIPEFPLPLLMAMSAIAGVVALTRMRRPASGRA